MKAKVYLIVPRYASSYSLAINNIHALVCCGKLVDKSKNTLPITAYIQYTTINSDSYMYYI